jgi:hypothetical protein
MIGSICIRSKEKRESALALALAIADAVEPSPQ